jgi:hypothetical protein
MEIVCARSRHKLLYSLLNPEKVHSAISWVPSSRDGLSVLKMNMQSHAFSTLSVMFQVVHPLLSSTCLHHTSQAILSCPLLDSLSDPCKYKILEAALIYSFLHFINHIIPPTFLPCWPIETSIPLHNLIPCCLVKAGQWNFVLSELYTNRLTVVKSWFKFLDAVGFCYLNIMCWTWSYLVCPAFKLRVLNHLKLIMLVCTKVLCLI